MVLLNKINLFENNVPLYNTRQTVNQSYVRTLEKIFAGTKWDYKYSFIVEYGIINRDEMISFINYLEQLNNREYLMEILNNIAIEDLSIGFAELDTYMHYRSKLLSNSPRIKNLKFLRYGRRFLGDPPFNQYILKWASKSYSYISIEKWDKNIILYSKIIDFSITRKLFSLSFLYNLDKFFGIIRSISFNLIYYLSNKS